MLALFAGAIGMYKNPQSRAYQLKIGMPRRYLYSKAN